MAAADIMPHLKAGKFRKLSSKDLVKRLHTSELQALHKVKNPDFVAALIKFEERELIRKYELQIMFSIYVFAFVSCVCFSSFLFFLSFSLICCLML